jgi:hypothetical protein
MSWALIMIGPIFSPPLADHKGPDTAAFLEEAHRLMISSIIHRVKEICCLL